VNIYVLSFASTGRHAIPIEVRYADIAILTFAATVQVPA